MSNEKKNFCCKKSAIRAAYAVQVDSSSTQPIGPVTQMPTTPSSSDGLDDFITFFQGFTRHDIDQQHTKILFQSYPEKPFKNELEQLSYFYKTVSKLSAAHKILADKNYLGYSGNFCFNEIEGRKVKENVKRIRCFVVDIDSGINAKVLEELITLVNPNYVVVSSRQEEIKEDKDSSDTSEKQYKYKAHFYWMLSNQLGLNEQLYEDWSLLQQALAFKIEDILVEEFNLSIPNPITGLTDKGITNPAGTMRVPGLMHLKNPENAYLSRVVHADKNIIITNENFNSFFNNLGIDAAYLQTIPERLEEIKQLRKAKKQTRAVLKEAEALYKPNKPTDTKISKYNGADVGDRHRSMVDYCRGLFFNRYFSLNEAFGAVKEENLKNNKPPLEEVELEGIVEWCFETYLNSLTAGKRERVLRGDSFAVKDLIKEATWNQVAPDGQPQNPADPKKHKPFQYDYSDLVNFPSLVSDNALAEKLMQRMAGHIGINESDEICSYVTSDGLWSFKDGYVYEKMKDVFYDTVTDAAVMSLYEDNKGRLIEKEWNNFKRGLYSSKQQNAIAAVLRKSTKILIKESEFNKNPNLIHVSNGTLDIETGKLRSWSPKDYITMSTKVMWIGDSSRIQSYKEDNYENSESLWVTFINTVMGGNLEMCRYLHKIFGYSLLGKNPEELIFFLYGDGQNGKSVFIETLINLLGDYAFTVPVGIFTENGKENKAAIVAQLPGKRMISTSEVKSSHSWDEESLKSMSGMDKVNARALFSKSFSFLPAFKTFIRGNHRPDIKSNDEGVWRRIRLVPFNVSIPSNRRDTKLVSKLSQAENLQELLIWAVAGYQLYLEEGLIPPVEAREATLEYRQEMNPVSTFMKECFDKIDDFKDGSSIDDILGVYKEWNAINAGEILTKQQLSKQLHKDKFQNKVIWNGEKAIKKYAVVINSKWKGVKGRNSGGNVLEVNFKRKDIKGGEEEQEG